MNRKSGQRWLRARTREEGLVVEGGEGARSCRPGWQFPHSPCDRTGGGETPPDATWGWSRSSCMAVGRPGGEKNESGWWWLRLGEGKLRRKVDKPDLHKD